ncbi:MAG: endonuclease/exonuclease/phosphatase family protein, partial [Candidatus Thiodiazotropha taylori]|nr:endonuclease/exonuclease/phosphatase family protein [Candidatus Thiodiazotropha taylori]
MQCALLNCQGLVTKRTNKLKSAEFQNIFESNDVVLLTETWTDQFSDLAVDNFEVFVLHRQEKKSGSKRNSGGIVLYLRNNLVSDDTLIYTSHDDILWVKISKSVLCLDNDLYICLCYVIPDESSRQALIETNIFDRLTESLIFIENKSEGNSNVLMCGDFNSRTSVNPDFVTDDDPAHMDVLPEEYTSDRFMQRFSEDAGHVNNNGLLLLELCKQTGLRIMNGRVGNDNGIGRYTFVGHRGSSLVDYVLGSQEMFNFVTSFEVQEPNILSDHCLVSFSFEFGSPEIHEDFEENFEYISEKYKWNNDLKDEYINRLNLESSKVRLHQLDTKISACSNGAEVQSCVTDFVTLLHDVATPLFKKSIKHNNASISFNQDNDNPWYNDECRQKKYYFMCMLDKYRGLKTDENRVDMVRARSEYKTVLRRCKYEYDKEKTNKFITSKNKNAKLYWNMLKELAHVKPANIALSSFEEYFKAVNNPADPFYLPDEDVIYFNERYVNNEFSVMFEELNLSLSQHEIIKSIKQLKSNKAGGPDKLINEFFIHGIHILAPVLCNLFNRVFDSGIFPEEWSEGYIIPLHKKGNLNDVENYRGITLLSALGKLFTRVVNNRLSEWSEKYFVLIEAQAGFRANMSTIDNIFVLHGLISHILNHGQKLYCAFIDFTKAFDYVVRENLWYKLIKFGLRGKILNIIKSMYTSVKSRVKYCNKLGNEFYCKLGVRQGECLSPLLFSMFLNDIEEHLVLSGLEGIDVNMFKMFLLLYADDIVLFANSADELQEGLNMLSDYCQRWKLKINVSKTKIMVFRKGGILPRNLAFYYDGELLEIVSKFRYLGIVFTAGGSFSEAQNTLAGQAQKAIFKMNKYLYKFTFLSPRHRLELFDKLVTPILNYGSEVWGFIKGNAIERVHLQFCKRLLGVKKTTQNDFVYGELGRTNYLTRRYLLIIKYWFKILSADEGKYVKLIYRLMQNDIDTKPNTVNWASLLRDLFSSLGFYEVWIQQGVGNYNNFISAVKQRLTDTFIQNWMARLGESSRANFYRTFAEFKLQPYLDNINIGKFSNALSRLRMASHRLEIESGRWVKPNSIPVIDRKCSNCSVLEDEYHFVLECPLYTDLRKKYIARHYWVRPSMFKFLELLNSSAESIRKLSIYIFYAFSQRSNLLYRGRNN